MEASYGLPYVADVHAGVGVSLSAKAELGPIYMTDLSVEGTYSTDPAVMNAFTITGALRAQAHAGLELDVKGYAGLRVLKHSVNMGAGIKGEAGLRAYAEARSSLGYREVASPAAGKRGEYYLKGHLEMAAQPVLALGGRLFVELDSPWWSPAPDKTWEWPIGSLEYPLPTQLGVAADIDHVIGSEQWPEVKLSEPSFDASKFVNTMMADRLPAKSGRAGEQRDQGSWQGVAPTAPTAAPPTVSKKPPAFASASRTIGRGGDPTPGKGRQLPEEKQNVPRTKDAAERWSAGLEALGELRKRAEKDPESATEIRQHLAELKARHGFTELSAERSGDVWLVDAAMNPKKTDIPVQADGKESPKEASAPGAARDGEEKTQRAALKAKVEERRTTVDRMIRAIPYDKEKLAHLAEPLFALKKPLRELLGGIDAASGLEELKMAGEDVQRGLKLVDPQLAAYRPLFIEAEQRRDQAETALDEDRQQWKEREQWEQAKRVVTEILASYKSELEAAVPGAAIKFRGSLATGWKGPHKVDKETGAARRFNPREFDCDAFVEIPSEMWMEELVRPRILPSTKVWATLLQVEQWSRAATIVSIEQSVCKRLVHLDGYQKEAGEPHFKMTLQTDRESLAKLLEGNVYSDGALSGAGARELEQELPAGWTRDGKLPGKVMPEKNEEI